MTHRDQDLEELRRELRAKWRTARRGCWTASIQATGPSLLLAGGDGTRVRIGELADFADAQLAAEARNALPRLFAEIDRLKRQTSLPVLGEIGEGGRITWSAAAGS